MRMEPPSGAEEIHWLLHLQGEALNFFVTCDLEERRELRRPRERHEGDPSAGQPHLQGHV